MALAAIHPQYDSLFVSPGWISVIEETFGCTVQVSTATHMGAVIGALPFVEVEDLRGRRIVSLPFSDYADPLVSDPLDWQALVHPILARRAPLRIRCLRNPVALTDENFDVSEHLAWHAVDLKRSREELWASLDASARQNIRKAEAGGLKIRIGTAIDDLRLFYEMHCRVRKEKYRLFAQPFALFENMHAIFAPGDRLFVLFAEVHGQAVAGILFLVHQTGLYYKFNASRDLQLRPNDLLVWTGMLIGQGRGLTHLDFGVSDLDQPGLVRFKRKFATEERLIAELRSRTHDPLTAREQQAGVFLGRLTQILTDQDVPDAITRAVGDEVYRFFC